MPRTILIYLLVLFCALLGAVGQVFFKLASGTFSFGPALLTNWKFIVGVGLYATATFLFVFALKYGNLSLLYPIIATSYIWVSLFAIFFLKESFPAFKWAGIALIIIGIVVITR